MTSRTFPNQGNVSHASKRKKKKKVTLLQIKNISADEEEKMQNTWFIIRIFTKENNKSCLFISPLCVFLRL